MIKVRAKIFLIFLLSAVVITLCISLCCCEKNNSGLTKTTEVTESVQTQTSSRLSEKRKLVCKNITQKEFNDSIENPRLYSPDNPGGIIAGGVVPHHTVATTLISGFFEAVNTKNSDNYDTVVIVAPNHQGDIGDVVLSFADWDIGNGVYCDTNIVEAVYNAVQGDYSIVEDDNRVEDDHSASVLIPYVEHYLPNAKAAVFLVSRTLALADIFNFAQTLTAAIKESGENILFISSADFSHYLSPPKAAENDKIMRTAIKEKNYSQIYSFSNEYIDSPASLITFLIYLSELGIKDGEVLYNTDASEFLGSISETTTYFVIAAYAS